MQGCGLDQTRFISEKDEGEEYRLHLVCSFHKVMVASHAHEDYVYLRGTSKGPNDQSLDVCVLVEKKAGKIMFGWCSCEA